MMRTPPLLLGCALAFWGWQADLLWVGLALGLVIESHHLILTRWEMSDEDFKRIWSFCLLALLALLLYIFNESSGPAALTNMTDAPERVRAQRDFARATSLSATSGIKWSPMIFYLFVLAHVFSVREKILLDTVSPFFWRNLAAARKAGENLSGGRQFNPTYPFFGLCLLAASFHPYDTHDYFWGFALLVGWALWRFRSARFGLVTTLILFVFAVAMGFGGQRELTNFQAWFGRVNAAWIAEMMARRSVDPSKSRTQIGQIGRLAQSPKIVIRVETPPGVSPPPLLREATYWSYRSQNWMSLAQGKFEEVAVESGGTSWALVPGKAAKGEVTIASYLDRRRDLLPLPSGVVRVENLDVDFLRTNLLGAAQAEGPGLVIFDALYAPGAAFDSPPVTNLDLAVPREESNSVAQVVASLRSDGLSDAEKLEAVRKYFADNYSYSIWQEPPSKTGGKVVGTPMSRFLLETHKGHCELFATATVFLLRQLGIPTRYAVGFVVHEQVGANNYVVRLRDGHAWCLVWNSARHQWEDFDTTPGSFIAEEAKRALPFQFLSDGWSRAWFEYSKFRWGQSQWRQYVLWALLPLLGFLLFQIFRKARRRNNRKSAGEKLRREWLGLDSEFYRLADDLTDVIGPRRAEQTWSDWLGQSLTDTRLAGLSAELGGLLELHYRHRFDPAGLGHADRERLRQIARRCRETLARQVVRKA